MSIQSEIDRINGNVASTYTALSEMGATMPETQNSDNLPGTVRTVPTGGGSSVQSDWNQNDSSAADFIKNKPLVVLSFDFGTFGLPKTAREIEDLQISGACVLFSITGTPITCIYDEAQNLVGCSATYINAVSVENGTMIFQGVLYQFDADGLMVDSFTGAWSGTIL